MTAIQVPKSVQDNTNDYVSFRVYDKKKDECNHYACYSQFMRNLPEVSIECFPNTKSVKNKLDNEIYLEWMLLCQQNNLLPQCATFYVNEEGQHYRYPKNLYDRHLLYTSLCCYRWSQHLIRMVWQVVKHCREKPITFSQALHYGIATYVAGTGHSFAPFTSSIYGCYGIDKDSRLNMAHSLIWKSFFAPGNLKNRIKVKDQQTYDTLNKCAKKEIGELKLSKLDDILTDKWTPLYQASYKKPKEWKKLYDEINAK